MNFLLILIADLLSEWVSGGGYVVNAAQLHETAMHT